MSSTTSEFASPHAAQPAVEKEQPRRSLLQPFSRITSGGRFVPCIDGLRCIAILAVVLYHLNGYVLEKATGFTEAEARESLLFHLLHGASCGVQIFFAISGFILALPFAREQFPGSRQVSLKQYFFRRVTRLEPPFLINLLIIYLLLIVVKKQSASSMLGPLFATMTYTHNFLYGTLSTINAVTWSLEIEVQFYIIAPFLARWYFAGTIHRRRTIISTVIILLMILKMIWIPENRLRLGLFYPLNHFLTGILAADIFMFSWKEKPATSRLWDLAGLAVLPAIFFIQLNTLTYHLLPILTFLLFIAAFRGPAFNRLLSVPLIVVTGGMCYSIYLYHFLVISFVGRFTIGATTGYQYLSQVVIQSALIMPPVICICAVFFVVFEKPFMKWRPKLKTI